MKWVKRAFWIAAWGVWLLFAVRLHLEIPRHNPNIADPRTPIALVGGSFRLVGPDENFIVDFGKMIHVDAALLTIHSTRLERIGVTELWHIQMCGKAIDFETFSIRDSGAIVYRLWGMPANPFETIFVKPPPANWPLLALCQTILALPLILLWAILRWRRNRKLRPAGVSP